MKDAFLFDHQEFYFIRDFLTRSRLNVTSQWEAFYYQHQ